MAVGGAERVSAVHVDDVGDRLRDEDHADQQREYVLREPEETQTVLVNT